MVLLYIIEGTNYSDNLSEIVIGPAHTMLWDSDLQPEIDMSQSGHVEVYSAGGGNIVVSAAIYRNGKLWGYLYPAVQ